jgi:chromosome segregation ATPase
MWAKVVEYGKQLVSVVQKLQKHEEDIKEVRQELREVRQDVNRLREEFRDLARVVERLAYTMQRDRDRAEAEQRIMLLEIENRFLRHERRLPTGERPEADA